METLHEADSVVEIKVIFVFKACTIVCPSNQIVNAFAFTCKGCMLQFVRLYLLCRTEINELLNTNVGRSEGIIGWIGETGHDAENSSGRDVGGRIALET